MNLDLHKVSSLRGVGSNTLAEITNLLDKIAEPEFTRDTSKFSESICNIIPEKSVKMVFSLPPERRIYL
jgi:hypothetical protein